MTGRPRERGLATAVAVALGWLAGACSSTPEPRASVEAAARRQKWIDQAQSLNIYMAGASGKKLDDTYKLAWNRGLKTTYYLRTLGATSAEKSTVRSGALNSVPSDGGADGQGQPQFCAIDDPTCEACQ